jgi:pyruvate ferredoxin oxidoreductase gamma subunit
MQEIRIHGRGGQGVVTTAEIIAIAAFYDNKNSQSFPSFGVERTGAPIEAFARIDNGLIRTREHIYRPDILIILDPTLIGAIDITKGCDEKTKIIINTCLPKEKLNIRLPEKNIYTVDAAKIALKIFKKNIINTAILGALAKKTSIIGLNSLKKAIKKKFSDKGPEIINKNLSAIEEIYKL